MSSHSENDRFARKYVPLATIHAKDFPAFQNYVQRKLHMKKALHFLTTSKADLRKGVTRHAVSITDIVKREPATPRTPLKPRPMPPLGQPSGSKSKTPGSSSHPVFDEEKYDEIFDWLYDLLDPTLQSMERFTSLPPFDVAALWTALTTLFHKAPRVQIKVELKSLTECRLLPGQDILAYTGKVAQHTNAIRTLCQKMSKEEFFDLLGLSFLEGGLPPEYDTHVTVFPDDITFEEAETRLQHAASKIVVSKIEEPPTTAFAAVKARHYAYRSRVCFDWTSSQGCANPRCKREHTPEEKGAHGEDVCHACGKKGHRRMSTHCAKYVRPPPPSAPRPNNARPSNASSAQIAAALAAQGEQLAMLTKALADKYPQRFPAVVCSATTASEGEKLRPYIFHTEPLRPAGPAPVPGSNFPDSRSTTLLSVLDTAATDTMSRREDFLKPGSTEKINVPVLTGNGITTARLRGKIDVQGIRDMDSMVVETLPPQIDHLISGPKIDERGYYSVYGGGRVTVYDRPPVPATGSNAVLEGQLDPREKLYVIDHDKDNYAHELSHVHDVNAYTMSQVFRTGISDIDLTHQRLGCWATEEILHDLGHKGKLSFCEFCVMGKSHRQPKSKKLKTEPKKAGTHLSIDIIGHKSHATPGGHVTGIIAMDRYSKFAMGVPLRKKGDEYVIYGVKKAVTYYNSRSQNKVVSITFDSEVVFKDSEGVRAQLGEMGIEATFSPPYTHNLNPVERTIQSIERIAQCLRERGGSLPQYWWFDLKQAMYIFNSTPKFNKKLSEERRSMSNEERLIGRKVNNSTGRIHSYLCKVYVHRDESVRTYGEAFAFEGVNFGNSWDTPGAYEVYNRKTRQMITTAHVSKFVESGPDAFPFQAARHARTALPEATEPLPAQVTSPLSENKQEFSESFYEASDDVVERETARTEAKLVPVREPPKLLTPSNARIPPARSPQKETPLPSLEPTTPCEGDVCEQGEEKHDSPQTIGLQPTREMPTPGKPNPDFSTRSRRSSAATTRPPASTTHEYEQQLRYEAAAAARRETRGTVPTIEGPKAKALWSLVKQYKKEERKQMLQGDSTDTQVEQQQEEMNKMVSEIAKAFVTWGETREPKHPRAAARSPNAEQWSKGEEEEMTSQDKYETYTIVIRPDGDVRVHQAGFVYKEKLEPDGTIRFKVRWVVKGNTMKKDIDFKETYAPVARVTTIRIVLALAACLDLECEHWDVKVAFLNAKIKEDVYCDLPEGFEATPEEGRQTKKRNLTDAQRKVLRQKYVCKLNSAIYGTPQAGREWYLMLCGLLVEFGFKRVESEHALFVYNGEEGYMVMAVWVDDILPAFTKGPLKDKLFAFFKSKGLQMKDLGEVERICGMRVTRDRLNKSITLDVEEYLNKVAQDHSADTSRTFTTPMDSSFQLTRDGGKQPLKVDRTKYLSLLGALMFAGVACRVDMSAAISHLATYMADPREQHMQALQRLLSYAAQHASLGLVLGGPNSKVELSGFADADWGANLDFRRSRSGFLFYFCGGLVDYRSWLQKTVATSSVHSEYMSASDAVREGMWLYYTIRDILAPLGIDLPLPITLHEDNQGCIALSKNPVNHSRNKHIDVKYHYIREQVENGFFILYYIETKKQLADFLTKPLNRVAFLRNRDAVMGGLG